VNTRLAERRFFSGMALVMLLAVVVGFARTYFFRPWFADAANFSPPEPYFFYVHGVSFVAWMILLAVQPLLVAGRRLQLHRTIGWFGAGLAAVMVAVGLVGAVMAARRPGGFIGVPVNPLEFLVVPLADLALFGVFVCLAVLRRNDAQSHKRLMLLATIGLIDAAVVRLPLGDMNAWVVDGMWTRTDVGVDLFLGPLVLWDFATRGRLHPWTLIGGLAVIASQPLRLVLGASDVWMQFAAWLVGPR
jgi:hypothetical protein